MKIIWDEPKRLSNLDKHGFDFADLTPDFFLHATIVPSKSGRLVAIGVLDEETVVLTVVFAPRGSEAISVVSMRRASRREREAII